MPTIFPLVPIEWGQRHFSDFWGVSLSSRVHGYFLIEFGGIPVGLGLAQSCWYCFYFIKEASVADPVLWGAFSITQGILGTWSIGGLFSLGGRQPQYF